MLFRIEKRRNGILDGLEWCCEGDFWLWFVRTWFFYMVMTNFFCSLKICWKSWEFEKKLERAEDLRVKLSRDFRPDRREKTKSSTNNNWSYSRKRIQVNPPGNWYQESICKSTRCECGQFSFARRVRSVIHTRLSPGLRFALLHQNVHPLPLKNNVPAYAKFDWLDPLALNTLLTDEEKQISYNPHLMYIDNRQMAHEYCQEKLQPRVLEAYRSESIHTYYSSNFSVWHKNSQGNGRTGISWCDDWWIRMFRGIKRRIRTHYSRSWTVWPFQPLFMKVLIRGTDLRWAYNLVWSCIQYMRSEVKNKRKSISQN